VYFLCFRFSKLRHNGFRLGDVADFSTKVQ
jgi:hypothetical protein